MTGPDVVVQNLRQRFSQFGAENLRNMSREQLKQALLAKIGIVDAENYSQNELDYQRHLSIKYHWGSNHDFGSFRMEGRMGDRHIEVMANFVRLFPIDIDSFQSKSVFDIGCWTGGATLLLTELGCEKVTAVEDVKKFAETV